METPPRIVVPPSVTAAGPTPPAAPPRPPDGDRDKRLVPTVVIGAAALLSMGAIGYVIGQRSTGTTTTADAAPEIAVLAEPSVTTAPTTTAPTTAAPTTAAPTTTAPTTTTTVADAARVLAGPPLRSTGTVRQAVLDGGVLYLRGRVPSEEFGAEIARRAEAVVGEGNVVNQYQVDPDAAPVDSAPLYVADTVLFPTGGTAINPAFLPLLDLGTKLLSLNENVQLTVIAHTDSAGSTGLNQRLSQARADTVRQYWIDQGADGARITAEGRGESEPIGDNGTPDGKQANRRAEFIVTGILG